MSSLGRRLSRSGRTLLAGRIMMASLAGGLLYIIAARGGVDQSGAGWIVIIPMSALFYTVAQAR